MKPGLSKALSSAIALLASIASAAIPIDNVCKESLNDGIRDNYSVYDTRTAAIEYQKRLCNIEASDYSTFSSKAGSLGIDVPFAKGILGLSASAQSDSGEFKKSFKSFCSDTKFIDNSTSTLISKRELVNISLANSYSECAEKFLDSYIALNKWGTFISVTPQTLMTGTPPLQSFTVEVTSRAVIPTVKIKNILPNNPSIKCFYNNKPVAGGSIFNTTEFQLTCTKPADQAVTFSLDTLAGSSNKVKIPNLKSRYDEMSEQIAALQGQVTRLSNLQANTASILNTNVNNLKSWPAGLIMTTSYAGFGGNVGESEQMMCQDGYYAVGVQVLNEDGGKFCTSCISKVRLICRPLNLKRSVPDILPSSRAWRVKWRAQQPDQCG